MKPEFLKSDLRKNQYMLQGKFQKEVMIGGGIALQESMLKPKKKSLSLLNFS